MKEMLFAIRDKNGIFDSIEYECKITGEFNEDFSF